MRAPSFEPWLSRIRLARALSAGAGFVTTWCLAFFGGTSWDQALINAFAAAVVCYFMGWACMLWLASAMHSNEYRKARNELKRRYDERDRRMHVLARKRLEAMGAEFDDTSGTMLLNGETLEAPLPPVRPELGRDAA